MAVSESTTQISAVISSETKRRMERYVRAQGIKKGYLIENAIAHHLRALEELPLDVIIPPVVLVSKQGGEGLRKRLENPPPPSKAMNELFDRES